MSTETTPMIRQYLMTKEKYQDAILFYRLGDFYEMFFDDARVASRILNLTLTSRNKNDKEAVPLCGVPYHSAQGYIQKLLEAGHKVAICEQMEDPSKAKGIVQREVVRVLSPGLILDHACLDESRPNFLVSIFYKADGWGVAGADISTGNFFVVELDSEGEFFDELRRIDPREILCEQAHETSPWVRRLKSEFSGIRINFLDGWHFDYDFVLDLYRRYYGVDPDGLGLNLNRGGQRAGGALLSHLSQTRLLTEKILERPQFYQRSHSMVLEGSAARHLELLKTSHEGEKRGSLLWFLDSTRTSMGARKIRSWVLYPLTEKVEIVKRQDAVSELLAHDDTEGLKDLLSKVADMERIRSRVLAHQAHARDLVAMGRSLAVLPRVQSILKGKGAILLKDIYDDLEPLPVVFKELIEALVDDPPLSLKEGGMIRQGYDAALDELRALEKNGKSTISVMEVKEREATGISSLKIRYNRVFGYYIEVTHVHRDKIPSHYIRKQTLVNAERFITPELKEYEDRVLGAAQKICDLEYDIFICLRDQVASYADPIKKNAELVAHVDALISLAEVAKKNRLVRPEILDRPCIEIIQGRHPLVEAMNQNEVFVPNDIRLDPESCRLMVITGPNMAGKSTILRQTALTVVMAQMGCYVPAKSARIGIVDRLFTRIGASDHLQMGRSTFMVEMLETSQILSQATSRSLVILDEIGRGTSTLDGLSIAWAVAEMLHDEVQALTLFATHYHELTDLASEKGSVRNFHMAVVEGDGVLRFVRELRPGGTNRSYGVHVAAMAGLPKKTLKRARQLLSLLEQNDLKFQSRADPAQSLSLFEPQESPALKKIREFPVDEATPLEALNFIARIKGEL